MESERTLLLQVLGPQMTEEEHEDLADSLDTALPEGYNAVLMHRNPRVEGLTRGEVRELVGELERAADLEERRPNAKIHGMEDAHE